jgi:hypothetical protein
MVAWHRSWKADIGLRLLGLLCGAVAGVMFSHLFAMRLPRAPGVLAYAMAATGFVSASASAALTLLGHHLFDEIEVSSRWRRDDTGGAAFALGLAAPQATAPNNRSDQSVPPVSVGAWQ